MTCGVYQILSVISGRSYVGSSQNIEKRLVWHRHILRKGRHHSAALQAAWRKHGEENFSYSILEECSKEDLAVAEKSWMDKLGALAPSGYNVCPNTDGIRGYTHSEITKQKMSEAAKRVASDPEERKRRRERAVEQWKNGNIGRKR